ncbi:MAG: DUF362 domain-containing protein [Candidatus Krumholzibacteria bacterium]|nr:DUF362 domain-containing protein [Candidatus Krumholzibacteria bacterium]
MSTDNDKTQEAEELQVIAERRAFLKRLAAAALVAVGSGWAALAPPKWPLSLRDPDGERGKPEVAVFRLPENGFVVQSSAVLPVMGIAHGADVDRAVRAAVDVIGGISRFVQTGDIVVIKPNVAFERAAVLGATTNPDVLKALIHLVREAGAREVRVADNPIESPESCFLRSGIRQAAIDAGARVYLPTPADFDTLHVPGAKWIENWPFFRNPFRDADKVIGVAPVKDHNLCGASMTTKNWYGLLGGRRNQFHQDIHGIIADLALMMRPTFVLLDGIRVLFRSGPTGGSLADVYEANTIVASTDSLAADAFGWENLLSRKGQDLPAYFEKAASKGLGNPQWRSVMHKEVQVG